MRCQVKFKTLKFNMRIMKLLKVALMICSDLKNITS